MYRIEEVKTKNQMKQFIEMPYTLFSHEKNRVMPLKFLQKKWLSPKRNKKLSENPHVFYIVYDKKNQPTGRILVGIDQKLNLQKGVKEVFFALFECIDDQTVADMLFDTAKRMAMRHNLDTIKGPVSVTGNDDDRGVLIQGFEHKNTIFNTYNPAYYIDLYQRYGFEKDMDFYAYALDIRNANVARYEKVVLYAMKKYRYRVDAFQKKDLKRELCDIYEIVKQAMPDEWRHLTVPSFEEIYQEAKKLKPFLDESLIYIARSGSRPIGFVAGVPDYNVLLSDMNGRLLPFGWIRFLLQRKRIDSARLFLQFVIPEFKNKGVNGAIFYLFMKEAGKKGYRKGEGSTVMEKNVEAIRSIESAGGKKYKVYRVYRKTVSRDR